MSIPKKSFWREIERPIKVLAPMAGYTDSAFRLICRSFGADVVMTELISADAVAYGKFEIRSSTSSDRPEQQSNGRNQKNQTNSKSEILNSKQNKIIVESRKNVSTAELLSFCEAEKPLVVQLFGKHPEKFAIAAKWITENLKPDGIDINMGCPARKVVGSDHGAALLKNPELAFEIVKAVKENTNLPVSVKTRLGWDNDDQILEFAPKMISAGAEALIVHGRTYKDAFSGAARWENIYRLKKILGDKAVVIGNGDIQRIISNDKFLISNKITKFKIQNSKFSLDGVAIGRAAFGKPWIFSENTDNSIQIKALKETILQHARLAFEDKGAKGIIEFRKHLLTYLKGFPNSKALRVEAVKIGNLSDIEQILLNI